MPEVVSQDMRGKVPVVAVYTTLDGATDTFTLNGRNQYLVIKNGTGSAASASMIGADAPAEIPCSGFEPVPTPPITIDTADGADEWYPVSSVKDQLAGVVTITGGTGLEVALVQV